MKPGFWPPFRWQRNSGSRHGCAEKLEFDGFGEFHQELQRFIGHFDQADRIVIIVGSRGVESTANFAIGVLCKMGKVRYLGGIYIRIIEKPFRTLSPTKTG